MSALFPEGTDGRHTFEKLRREAERKARLQTGNKLKAISKEIRQFDDNVVASENRARQARRKQAGDSGRNDESASKSAWFRLRQVGAWWRIAKFHLFFYMSERAKKRRKPLSAAYWLKKCIKTAPPASGSAAAVFWVLYDDLARALTDAGRHDEAEEAWKLALEAQRETEKR